MHRLKVIQPRGRFKTIALQLYRLAVLVVIVVIALIFVMGRAPDTATDATTTAPTTEAPATGTAPADDDLLVTEVLQKMIKQRRESVDLYRKGNREELAAKEEAEIAVIERFLPAQMDDAEAGAAIQAIIAELGASSMKDMGRVMGLVKERHASSIEPARASALVKAALA